MVKIIVSLAVLSVVIFSCVLTWKDYITKTDNWKVMLISLAVYIVYMSW